MQKPNYNPRVQSGRVRGRRLVIPPGGDLRDADEQRAILEVATLELQGHDTANAVISGRVFAAEDKRFTVTYCLLMGMGAGRGWDLDTAVVIGRDIRGFGAAAPVALTPGFVRAPHLCVNTVTAAIIISGSAGEYTIDADAEVRGASTPTWLHQPTT